VFALVCCAAGIEGVSHTETAEREKQAAVEKEEKARKVQVIKEQARKREEAESERCVYTHAHITCSYIRTNAPSRNQFVFLTLKPPQPCRLLALQDQRQKELEWRRCVLPAPKLCHHLYLVSAPTDELTEPTFFNPCNKFLLMTSVLTK
jgi:hypothetical protein